MGKAKEKKIIYCKEQEEDMRIDWKEQDEYV